MKINKHIIVIALALLSACSSKPGDEPKAEEFVRYSTDNIMHSDILGTDIPFSILLPESYQADQSAKYSVVYMLHGYGDNWKSWNGNYLHANSKIQSLEGRGLSEMIYVFPCGFTTYYCNFYNGKYDYMDMFTQELIPYIDRTYRTIADKDHRSITGYSMGGFGAMVLPLKHPELFNSSAPLSMSFRTDEQYMAESQSGWDGQWGKIFGGVGKSGQERLTEYYKAHCPLYQFNSEHQAELSTVNWFFTCGDDEEQLLIANDALHVMMRDNSYAHEFRVGNGGHKSSYWMDALEEVLPWFDHNMNGASQWPSCSFSNYSLKEVATDENGAVLSQKYASDGSARAIFLFHNEEDASTVRDLLSVAFSASASANYVLAPCDLSQKTVEEWMSYYKDKYSFASALAISVGEAGRLVFDRKDLFPAQYFVKAFIPDEFQTAEGEKYYFATTDDSPDYGDMAKLYRSCRSSGADFEYRVINGSGNAAEDLLRCLEKLKPYLEY